MDTAPLPILLFVLASTGLAVGLLVVGRMFGPSRQGRVKEMPYESGMDPIHDTRRRFDVRFHLIAIAFLVFDVEVLFLYPWAVAAKRPEQPLVLLVDKSHSMAARDGKTAATEALEPKQEEMLPA